MAKTVSPLAPMGMACVLAGGAGRDPRVLVQSGDRVREGQVIGKLGNAGNTDPPALHAHRREGAAHLGRLALRDPRDPYPGASSPTTTPSWASRRRRSPQCSRASSVTDCRCIGPSKTSVEADVTATRHRCGKSHIQSVVEPKRQELYYDHH